MKIRMIYLAAGNSRRFGSNKLYYEMKNKPMFQYGMDTLFQVLERCEDTTLTVVTEYPAVGEYARKQQNIWKDRIFVTGSPDREKGISYSIRAGIANPDADYYLFCVADQPWIRAETVLQLIYKTVEGGFAGGYVEWNGRSGNPTIFSKDLLPILLTLEGDIGGKRILLRRKDVCAVSAREQKELEDVDKSERINEI